MTTEPAPTPDRPDRDVPHGERAPDDAGVPGPGVDAPLFTAHLEEGLDAALRDLAGAGRLLVALDFDGVLAPIVVDPTASRILPVSARALADLAVLDGVDVVLVSGRNAADLATLADVPDGTRVIGSHGAELGRVTLTPDGQRGVDAEALSLSEDQAALRAELLRETEELAAAVEGAWVQAKPAAVVLHTRPAAPEDGAELTRRVLAGPAAHDGVHVVVGKEVVEMAVLAVTKGDAVTTLRSDVGADAVLYAGDDTTDEDAFAVLTGDDVGIKVGDGETLAGWRVADPEEFSAVLVRLAELRQETSVTRS
ncbi:trehalose-phosphatase [Georgenia muralis]|uniref:Trehalose 6-phosphate phosphatase n=1 Tax=Georgenia muralis TaxID=154117 RepID=A0A3N4Z3R7_9MICO|nr:trehalose-phosphatase [Georgenia muralis]RPF26484.1 trehalose 6-phosphatase [Georgenia muralis]